MVISYKHLSGVMGMFRRNRVKLKIFILLAALSFSVMFLLGACTGKQVIETDIDSGRVEVSEPAQNKQVFFDDALDEPVMMVSEPLYEDTEKNKQEPHLKNADYLTVLIYHHLAPVELGLHKKNPMVLSVDAFKSHMLFLKENNYYTPSLSEVEAFILGKTELPEKSVLITFDDGLESNYQYAHPILEELGLRAVEFIIGSVISSRQDTTENKFDPSVLTRLSWEQLMIMVNSGVWEVGSHTYNGHHKIDETPVLLTWTEEELFTDFNLFNGSLYTHFLPKTVAIAYPFDAYNTEVLAAVSSGYCLGFTARGGYIRPGDNQLLLPRHGIFPWHSLDQLKKILDGARHPLSS